MNRRGFFRSLLAGACVGLAASTLRPKELEPETVELVEFWEKEPMGVSGVFGNWPPPKFAGIPIVADKNVGAGQCYVIDKSITMPTIADAHLNRVAVLDLFS